MMITRIAPFFLLATPLLAAEPAGYAKPELLVDAPVFMRLLLSDDHAVVPLDVRPRAQFDRGHLPTAKYVDVAAWKKAFGDGTDADAWSKRIGDLGIEPGVTVVVYDGSTSPNATRVWWILKYWGVADVRVLDGGYRGGQPAPIAKPLGDRSPTEFVATPQPERIALFNEVQAAVGSRSVCVVDARSAAEFAQGAIPATKSSDWARYVDPATGKLRPTKELQTLLDEAGFEAEKPAIAYCRSGGRASLVAFVMELMSGQPVANYYASYPDWQRQQSGAQR